MNRCDGDGVITYVRLSITVFPFLLAYDCVGSVSSYSQAANALFQSAFPLMESLAGPLG